MEFRNAVFVVTEEFSCPLYNVGEEFAVQNSALTVERDKHICLLLVRELLKVLADSRPFEQRITRQGVQKAKFECGGCTGLVRFEYKKEKAYSTLQMNLLKAAEQRAKQQIIAQFFGILREMDLFEPLSDFDLQDLALLMKMKSYPPNKIIIEEGERGTTFYVVLSGKVAVVRKDSEIIAEIGPGGMFGEMSLLSGELTYPSVYSRTASQLATLNAKDFKHVLSKYPILQIFFYRVLVSRAQENTLKAGKISSGMNGDLNEINPVDLFQMINSGGKSGRVSFILDDGEGEALFNEGEIVGCRYRGQRDKDAFFALLVQQKGRFTYTKGLTENEKHLSVLGGFMGLVMEGLQRIDERQDIGEEE
ncbi:cyclic nucleotide-binding domain-containing protein [Desulfobulbus sp. F4]|nr:cyclic nucleotide-binding domain-containing protein [Desulfobulbus sp. F3]MCW5200756.1 cyclic nucleotide-binding domain-containing protein [Desulfobulbus sp. F4]